MKIFVFIMVILAIAMMANVNLMAQLDPPCDFPCEDEIWTHHPQAVFGYLDCLPEEPPKYCTFYITYDEQMRICDGVAHYNIYISEISWTPDCNNCAGLASGPEKLYKAFNLLMDWYFDTMMNLEDRYVVTFQHIACWANCAPALNMLVPCDTLGENCCTTTLTFERIDNFMICTSDIYYVPQDTCAAQCQLTCEIQWHQKQGTEKQYHLTRPEIIPNPAKDNLDIGFNSDYVGAVKIQVYDLNGGVVLSFQRDKPEYILKTNIDISTLKSGSYIIYIYINDSQMIWSNKFIKEK